MIKLRTELNKILKEIHPNVTVDGKSMSRVHFQGALDTTPFPYIVYDLPQSYLADDQETFNLDVDVWDKPSDGNTTELETLCSSIWKVLNRYYHIDDDIQFTIYRASRHTVDDDDRTIKRRLLTFNIKYHDRRVN